RLARARIPRHDRTGRARGCRRRAREATAEVRLVNEPQLRKLLGGEPTELVRKKIADRLNPLTRQFVERSPFVVVATGRLDGDRSTDCRVGGLRRSAIFFRTRSEIGR